MATTLYFRTTTIAPHCLYWAGGLQTRLDGVSDEYTSLGLTTATGSGAASFAENSVAGPTNGVEVQNALNTQTHDWVTAPVTADFTLSGTISFNVWASENAMADNATVGAVVEKIGPTGTVTSIGQAIRGTELPTTAAAQTWTITPTSTGINKGDRLRVRLYFDDATGVTMAAGGNNLIIRIGGATGGADGDSFVTFTETFSLQETDPSGTTIYLTNTASSVATASVDREAWTSRGAGVQNDVTNTQTGFVSPIQVTDTAGGTVVDWFTQQLTAFTLGGTVKYNVWGQESNASANATIRAEIARVDSDGTNATVWASHSLGGEFALTAGGVADAGYLSGDDLSITDGQRLRLRLYIEDAQFAMASGHTATIYYAASSGGTSGDTFFIFSQTLTEFSGGGTFTDETPFRSIVIS